MAGLNNDEAQFVEQISAGTGIDPRVVAAWTYQEGGFKKGGTGGFNYLNIRPVQGDNHVSVSDKGFAQFANVNDAIKATLAVLHQPNMRIILTTAAAKPTPQKQINAIGSSPWGTNGSGLTDTFASFFTKAGLSDSYVGPGQAKQVANTVGSGSAADWTSYDAHNAAHDIAAPVFDLKNWFEGLLGNWQRIAFVVVGIILVLIAIVYLVKSSQSNTFTFSRGDE